MRTKALHIYMAGCLLAALLAAAVPVSAQSPEQPPERALLLEEVRFTGNDKIPEEVLRGALTIGRGDTVSVETIERERLRVLHSHHLIRGVRVSASPGPALGLVVLEMEIEERGRYSLETGFGYHDIHGWFVTVAGIRCEPAAPGDSWWRAGARIGFHLAGIDADWEKPGLLRTGMGIGARGYIYNEEHLFFGAGGTGGGMEWGGPAEREFRQEIARAGAELYLLYRYERDTKFTFGLRAESAEPDSTFEDQDSGGELGPADLPAPMLGAAKKTAITGFQFRLIRDTRDLPAWPRAGSFTHLSIQTNGTILGGDEIFTKADLDVRIYAGLGGWRTLAGRVRAGLTSTGAPYYDRFFIGGIHSIRGFEELSLSPASGHDGYWLAGCELRVPLIDSGAKPPRLTGLLFFDAGQGWLRGAPLSTATVESAFGYGMRLRLPWLGTLGLDFGLPLSEGTTGERYQVHGSLGFSF